MVEFRLKLADDFHRKIKATAAMEGVTMQQMIVLALDSFVVNPKASKVKKSKRGKK